MAASCDLASSSRLAAAISWLKSSASADTSAGPATGTGPAGRCAVAARTPAARTAMGRATRR